MAWNSLLEDCNFIETPDFFKQILWGCFGLRTASEVKSDLLIGFLLANLPYPPNFRSLGHPHGLQKLVERERARNRQLLYLRNSFTVAGKNEALTGFDPRYTFQKQNEQGCDELSRVSGRTKRTNPTVSCLLFSYSGIISLYWSEPKEPTMHISHVLHPSNVRCKLCNPS